MKKLLVVLMVLAFVGPAMADEILDVSGSMRVEAYSLGNTGFSDADTADKDYWDQRLRIQMKFKPADGVMAVLRTDIAEDPWGRHSARPGATTTVATQVDGVDQLGQDASGDQGYLGSTSVNSIIMIDRAYLDINKGMVNINAGLNTWNLGNGIAYNNQGSGIQLTLKTPLTIRVGYTKENENESVVDTTTTPPTRTTAALSDAEGFEDTDSFFVDLGFKNDAMALNFYYAAITDGRDGDRFEPNVFGAQFVGKLGPVNLNAELDIFGGNDASGNDLFGTQFYADVMLALSDQLTVGSHVIYAAGTDDDSETQITAVVDSADVVVQDKILPQSGPGAFEPFGAGDDVFSVGNSQGAMGLGPYVKFKVMDDLTLAAHLIYVAAATDAATSREAAEIDSMLFYGVGASWALAPKSKLDFGYAAATKSEGDKNTTDFETATAISAVISVSF